MSKATPILQAILEAEIKGWFLHFKEQQLAKLQHKRVSDDQAEKVGFVSHHASIPWSPSLGIEGSEYLLSCFGRAGNQPRRHG